jgi:phospholipase C
LFVHAATSDGHVDNTFRLYDMPTIYDRLDTAKVDWAIYYHDIPQAACLHELVDRTDSQGRRCMRSIDQFYKDARRHTAGPTGNKALPSYVFIEPGYFEPARTVLDRIVDVGKWLLHLVGFPVKPSMNHPNDQHAPHDVRLGEHLIADVYEALRANADVWNETLLIVLHDEHGGLYDHVAPGEAENPDGKSSADPKFDFDRLGLRVPAILVSPFLKAQTESTVYEHASIVRTVREHFCPEQPELNKRDAAATPLRTELFASAARTDAPRRMARPMAVWRIPRFGNPETRPVSDLHQTLVELAGSVGTAAPAPSTTPAHGAAGMSEADGHRFVQAQVDRRMGGGSVRGL